MEVAFIHPSVPGAEGTGATHSATIIVRTLARRGHDVTVFARDRPATDTQPGDAGDRDRPTPDSQGSQAGGPRTANADDAQTTDVEIRHLDVADHSRHTATGLNRALRQRLRDGSFDTFDVVHSYLPTAMPALGRVGTVTGVRTVVTLNAYGGVCPKNDLRYMDREPCRERGLLRCVTCAVATSGGHDEFGPLYRAASRLGNLREVRRGLRYSDGIDAFQALTPTVREAYTAFEFPAERIAVVPTPLDERFLRDREPAFDPPYDLLYVGALERHKGVERLVPTLEQVRERGIDARLTLVGDGGRRSVVAEQARDRGVAAYVSLAGQQPYGDLPSVYADHDLFVYPGAWDEPFGRVLIEALATETPIVATDVGSAKRLIGQAGVVTEPSAPGLATGIVSAVRDVGLATLSARSRDQLDPFRTDRVVTALEALYADGPTGFSREWGL